MRTAILLLACAACSPGVVDADPSSAPTDYATQIDPPTPDYAALIAAQPKIVPRDTSIEATAPLPADAKAVGQAWVDRLQARDGLDGFGLNGDGPDGPVRMIGARMPRGEFDRWVEENGWQIPPHIAFTFIDPLSYPAVSDAAKPRIRAWPGRKGRTGAQNMAALGGKVFVRDGCFFVRKHGGEEALAWFLGETGLDVDDEGYLILVNRVTGWTMARVGEEMTWAGPNAAPKPEETAELRKACGEHPVAEVGNPEANERMYVTYPHLRELRVPPHPPTHD